MAHIIDGVVSLPVLVACTSLAVAGVGIGLKRLDPDSLPIVGVMSSVFFVASLVQIPVGLGSVHLLLNGLLGLILGWTAVPAIFVALVLQASFFGYGGVSTLGVNTVVMALPAVLAAYLFSARALAARPFLRGAVAGAFSVTATCLGVGATLALSGPEYHGAAMVVMAGHLPVLVVESFVTGTIVAFLARVRPEVLTFQPRLSPSRAGDA